MIADERQLHQAYLILSATLVYSLLPEEGTLLAVRGSVCQIRSVAAYSVLGYCLDRAKVWHVLVFPLLEP